MQEQNDAGAILGRMRAICPAGFGIGLHIKFTSPRYLFQAYDKEWLDAYSRDGLVLKDPTVHWGFANTGTIRWSALRAPDEAGVMSRAASFGLRYGATAATVENGSRSIGNFARSDRELTDGEIADLAVDFANLHRLTMGAESFAPAVHAALRQMSIFLTRG